MWIVVVVAVLVLLFVSVVSGGGGGGGGGEDDGEVLASAVEGRKEAVGGEFGEAGEGGQMVGVDGIIGGGCCCSDG